LATIYISRVLKAGILALGLFYLCSLLWLFSKRLVYPYELDWIEGGMLTSVMQILDGHNLYSAPSITYVPFIYAPVFFYLSALAAKILGASLLTLRLVSAVATLVSLATIILIVRGETKSWFWGCVSAGLFAGLYPATRFWFDLARVDSVFLMFFLLFLFSLRHSNTLRWQILSGVFLSLTVLTKQNGAVMCLPILAVYFLFQWRSRLALPLTFVLVYGGLSLAFILSSGGWYTYYSYTLIASKPNFWLSYSFFEFIKDFMVPHISVAALFSLFLFPLWFFRGSKERLFLWLAVFVSTLITSYLAKSNVGGVNNVVIPTFAICCILFGVGVSEMLAFLRPRRYHALFEIGFCLLVLFQLGQVVYNPVLSIPSLDDYRSGTKAVKFIKKFDGDVYVPNSAIALMAGKKTFAHPSAIWEVLISQGNSSAKDILESELKKAVDAKTFDAIVILPLYQYFPDPDLQQNYALDSTRYILVDADWHEKALVYLVRQLPKK
jgi:hypothetical protein